MTDKSKIELMLLVQAASLFKSKEILVTVTEEEKQSLIGDLLNDGHAVDYSSSPPVVKMNIQSVSYQGVTIHFNIV